MTHEPTPDPAAEKTGEEQRRSSSMPVDPAVGATVGGALGVALLFWLLSRLRLRRQQQRTPSEKLVQAGRDASTAVGQHAGRVAAEASDVAHRAATVAAPAVMTGVAVLTQEGRRTAARVAEAGSHAVEAGAHARDEVAETLEHAQKRVGRFFLKVLAGLSFAGGYVLGAQAGRERYEQIVQGAGQVRTRITGKV